MNVAVQRRGADGRKKARKRWMGVAESGRDPNKGFWDCLWDKEEVGAGFVDGGIYGSRLSSE